MNDDLLQTSSFSHNGEISSGNGLPHDDQDAVDDVLCIVANHYAALGDAIGQEKTIESMVALRQSPLGRKLHRLASAARGGEDVDLSSVQADVDEVVALLLQPLAATDHQVPEWFWQTSIGNLLARATIRTYTTDQLLCLASAAERLNQAPATVERLIANGTLTAVRDETGKLFIPVKQIDQFRTIARVFDGSPSPPADSLVAARAA